MDPGISIGLVSNIVSLANYVYRSTRTSIAGSYGPFLGFIVPIFFRKTASEYERLQRVVLLGEDHAAEVFRQSVTDECNMTAVAVGRTFPNYRSRDPDYLGGFCRVPL